MQIDKLDGVLRIAGDVGINVVEQLHSVLREFVSTAARPTVDLSDVENCDAAVLQLLTSARKTAERANKPFDFAGVSAAVLDASAVLGLSLHDQSGEQEKRGIENAAI
ncbi:MAG: STAS domain-containing protein [Ignavibacteriota bacterium]